MALDLLFFAVAIPAVMIAAISKAGFGSGASFVAAPILAVIVDPRLALGIMLPLLMLVDVASLKAYWGKWSGTDALRLTLGAMPGVAVGAALSQIADPDVFRVLIGVICLMFVGWQMFRARGGGPIRKSAWPPVVGYLSGAGAGFTSFVSHAGGPVLAVYLLSQGLGKTTYQATTVITFWATNVVKFIPYAALGFFTTETLVANIVLAPVALIGTWIGVRAHYLVPERVFFALTYVLLLATGTKLIWDALT